jgi:hypothetical protein
MQEHMNCQKIVQSTNKIAWMMMGGGWIKGESNSDSLVSSCFQVTVFNTLSAWLHLLGASVINSTVTIMKAQHKNDPVIILGFYLTLSLKNTGHC